MTSQAFAPVALFAYKRPDHLRQTLASLAANAEAPQTELHIFCDGPKNETDTAAVAQVRAIAASAQGFAHVQIHSRERNAGLARSIIDGVGRIVAEHGSVIVVEDDLIVSPHFLAYLNDGLRVYENDNEVASVHAYCYSTSRTLPPTFFLRGADCWGWATWARAWRVFNPDAQQLLAELHSRSLTDEFDRHGAMPFTKMLSKQAEGGIDSWAIRWHASAFLAGMYTLYPGRSLVRNIGFDGSGTHAGANDAYAVALADRPVAIERISIEEQPAAAAAFAEALRVTQSPPRAKPRPWLSRLWRRATS